MEQIMELIRSRRSVRTFSHKEIDEDTLAKMRAFMKYIPNPFGDPDGIPMRFELLNAREHGLSSPVISGEAWYVAAAIERGAYSDFAFGYTFEKMVLYAWSLGLGTTWMGGTMNSSLFERAIGRGVSEEMLAVTPLGYPAEKMSLRETVMRKGCKADTRKDFEELFFDGGFGKPLTRARAGRLEQPLEAVRLAPSAVNRQPWRVVVTEDAVHFYVKKLKGIPVPAMQKMDLGIALCHFDLVCEELGISTEFCINDPKLPAADAEYVAGYLLK